MQQDRPSQVGAFNPTVPLDWSELGSQILECAVTLASAHDAGAWIGCESRGTPYGFEVRPAAAGGRCEGGES